GITHFEFGGGARFQSLYFYLNEDAFEMMDKFREVAGPKANLQTLSRGVNTVTLDTGSREIVDLHAKLFKKHGTTTIRNFDALNDVENLKYSGERIVHHGLKHEVVITLMDLPPGCSGAHDVPFYEKTLREILDAEIIYDSICFKDASGTSSPQKVFDTIKMAKRLLPEGTHVRLHTHETAGVSVACYLAALEAGADGIDMAASPVSGGTSQPDILTMLHAVKGKPYDLGGLDVEKILTYEEVLQDCLRDYFMPPEAVQVSPLIPFSPMPGGALTSNTQMMRDNNILDRFSEVIKAMREVVEKGGYGTSVTPVSQFYFQQAFNNVMFGPWEKIADGYGKMILGYFGKTPAKPDENIINLASKQLKLEPTKENAIDLADKDDTKSIIYAKNILNKEKIPDTEENIFIVLACKEKGVAFLKGETKVNVRKNSEEKIMGTASIKTTKSTPSSYTVVVDGISYNVKVAEGEGVVLSSVESTPSSLKEHNGSGEYRIEATLPGSVFKILVKPGDAVKEGQVLVILEAMKMEIEIPSPKDGKVKDVSVTVGETVENGQLLVVL
ncbi:MAG: biotin attachment protein, partial [Campylobacteraceae bacterium]|nr:biotin attachment protein [Campylobacteraceae bacterium]